HQGQKAQDALAVDLVAGLGDRDLARELRRGLHELGPRARVQPELVLDLHGPLCAIVGGHHVPRSTSRWRTRMSHDEASRRRSSSTITTERCRPPVQPTQIVTYSLPSFWNCGSENRSKLSIWRTSSSPSGPS